MRRFFYDSTLTTAHATISPLNQHLLGDSIALTESIVHHWCRVLRANIGDVGILFDGFGGEYEVELTHISKKSATATLRHHYQDDRTAPIMTCMGLVMSRGDRMDYAIQKATELGVTAIQLLSSHHGEVHLKANQAAKKLMHWQQVAISACEQCGLNRPPILLAPMAIEQWLALLHNTESKQNNNSQSIICQQNLSATIHPLHPLVHSLIQSEYYQRLHTTPELKLMLAVPESSSGAAPAKLISTLKQTNPYIALLIGPEGGLSPAECQLAIKSGFEAWQIGNRVLRTETAPVVALATLNALYDVSA